MQWFQIKRNVKSWNVVTVIMLKNHLATNQTTLSQTVGKHITITAIADNPSKHTFVRPVKEYYGELETKLFNGLSTGNGLVRTGIYIREPECSLHKILLQGVDHIICGCILKLKQKLSLSLSRIILIHIVCK